MVDHIERKEFFEEVLHTLFKIEPNHADCKLHIALLRSIINHHLDHDKFALALSELTDAELEMLIRFIERPRGRHHIHEVKNLWENYGAEQAGKLLIKHFYDHNRSELIHSRALKIHFR